MEMKLVVTVSELIDNGSWDKYCEKYGINAWAVNEGLMNADEEISLTEDEAKKFGFIGGSVVWK